MRRIALFLAVIGLTTLGSCSSSDDKDTIGEVFEYTGVNFQPADYSVVLPFPHQIYASDMVLVYRLSGSFQGEDVWKLLPETYFFDDGTLDLRYDFDFTRFDAEVHLEGFDLAGVTDAYRLNQIFRVVVVPASFGKNTNVNFRNYKDVIREYKIDESKIVRVSEN